MSSPQASGNSRLLCVVIAAHRVRHLRQCLQSLAGQTCRDFVVYVCDDASADDLGAVVAEFRELLELRYHRFEANLGGRDLVAQWERCIALSSEPWIWLLGDDDEAEPRCVEVFLAALRDGKGGRGLYRYDSDHIDDAGRLLRHNPPHPREESSAELLNAFFHNPAKRQWAAPDHVFSRAVHAQYGGFVSFPRALYADYATWALFATQRGVCTLQGARLRLRRHEESISSNWARHRLDYVLAATAFVRWVRQEPRLNLAQAERRVLLQASWRWFYRWISYASPPLTPAQRRVMREQAGKTWNLGQRLAGESLYWYGRLKSWRRGLRQARWLRFLPGGASALDAAARRPRIS